MVKSRTGRSRKGSALLYVIVVFMVVTMLATTMLSQVMQAAYQNQTYSMRMQAYYLTEEVADAVVAALIQPDTSTTNPTLLEQLGDSSIVADPDKDLITEVVPSYFSGSPAGYQPNVVTHYALDDTGHPTAEKIGTSTIKLSKQAIKYNDETKDWIVADIHTEIDDQRITRNGEKFVFEGSVSVQIENSAIRIYNISL